MFITVYTYRTRADRSETTIELHRELGHHPDWRGPGFLSAELLQSLEDRQEFVEITRFSDEALARATTRRSQFLAWRSRLLETLEEGPSFSHFHSVAGFHDASPEVRPVETPSGDGP